MDNNQNKKNKNNPNNNRQGLGIVLITDPAGGFCIGFVLFCYGQYKSKGDQL